MARPPSRGRRVGRPPGGRAGGDTGRARPGFEGFAAAHGFAAPRDERERPSGGDGRASQRDDSGGPEAGFDPREFEMPPDPPPGARPRGGPGSPPRGLPDLSVILVVLDAVRAAVPRELQSQFTALLREVLLTVRVLIDRYLERLDGRSPRSRVEDIPID